MGVWVNKLDFLLVRVKWSEDDLGKNLYHVKNIYLYPLLIRRNDRTATLQPCNLATSQSLVYYF